MVATLQAVIVVATTTPLDSPPRRLFAILTAHGHYFGSRDSDGSTVPVRLDGFIVLALWVDPL